MDNYSCPTQAPDQVEVKNPEHGPLEGPRCWMSSDLNAYVFKSLADMALARFMASLDNTGSLGSAEQCQRAV